jgi:uncharacterized protein involved in outer membrane biogenesis
VRKLVLITLGVVVALGIAAGGVVAFLAGRIDEAQMRAILAQRLADGLGRPVSIAGKLTLELGLTPSVTVERVSIGNAPWGSAETMLEIDRFEAALQLVPLLSRRISIARLKLTGATVLLETDANGRGNWQLGEGGGGTRPFFYQVEAEQVQVTYRDSASGKSYRAVIERAAAVADRRDGQLALSLAGRFEGERIDLAGNLGPLNALLEEQGSALSIDLSAHALGVRASIKGGIREPQALRGVTLAVNLSGNDTKLLGRLMDQPPMLGPWRIAGRLEDRTGRLSLRGLEGSVGDRAILLITAKGQIDDVLATQGSRGVRLNLTVEGADTSKLSPLLGTAVPAIGQLEGRARLEETTGRLTLPELDLAVGGRDVVAIVARGSVAEPLAPDGPRGVELDLVLEGQATEALTPVIGMPIPTVGAYRLSAHVSGSGRGWDLSRLTLRVGGSDVSGDARIDLARPRPRFEARLESDLLNLVEWRDRGSRPSTPPPPRDGRVFGTGPLLPEGFGSFDLSLRLAAKELRTIDFFAQEVLADLELKDRLLTVRPSNLQLFDGRLSLEGAMDARSAVPQLRAKLAARNLDAGRLSRALGATETLDGLLDLNLDLTGRGGTPRSLAASLNGRAGATLSNGRIANRHIEWIAADLLRVLLPGGGEPETAISCAVGQFDIKAGIATAQALLVDTRRVVVTGSGTVNLGNETLALKLDPKPKEPSLISLAHPMLIGGTFKAPTVRPDPAGVAKGIGGAALGLAMGPLGLLLPFVSAGAGDANPCAKLLSGKR